jgi:hypothetical protein
VNADVQSLLNHHEPSRHRVIDRYVGNLPPMPGVSFRRL